MFPKDVMALSNLAKDIGIDPKILTSVIDVNENQPKVIVDILKNNIEDLHEEYTTLGWPLSPILMILENQFPSN